MFNTKLDDGNRTIGPQKMALTICRWKVQISRWVEVPPNTVLRYDLNVLEQGKAHAFNTPSP